MGMSAIVEATVCFDLAKLLGLIPAEYHIQF